VKTSWHRGRGEDHHAPVEMRFIDMFMTALGSLVFLALLLVFLLPKTTQLKAGEDEIRKQIDDLIAENKHRQQQIELLRQQIRQHQTEDKNIMKRWFGVLLVTKGCRSAEPELYVRWEGKLVSFETEEPMPDPLEFDASNVTNKTALSGHRYFEVGDGPQIGPIIESVLRPMNGTGLEALNKNGLHAKLFYGAGRRSGSWSIYAGLSDPSAQADNECTIYPIYLSSQGLVPGEKIPMAQRRPYAWLRRFTLHHDGTTTLGTPPRADDKFKDDIAEFSNKQSQALCEKKSLCGTIDAHYAVLSSSSPNSGAEFTTYDSSDIYGGDFQKIANSELKACADSCLSDARCKAYSFDKWNRVCFLKGHVGPLLLEPSSFTGVRAGIRIERATSAAEVEKRTNRAVAGLMYASRSTTGADACQQLCANDAKCVSFSYVKVKQCRLYSTVDDYIAQAGVESGIKRQKP
jgi:cell division protein FtsB